MTVQSARAERHYAIALDGRVMTFECRQGHRYRHDFDRRKRDRQVATAALARFVRFWSRANGGVSCKRADCPTCRRAEAREKREVRS